MATYKIIDVTPEGERVVGSEDHASLPASLHDLAKRQDVVMVTVQYRDEADPSKIETRHWRIDN